MAADDATQPPPDPRYRVGQAVAVARAGQLQVGTIRGAAQVGTGWRYRIAFGPDWWEWVEGPAIAGVQGELF